MAKIFVTGSTGFVGSNVIPYLLARGHQVSAAVRSSGTAPSGAEEVVLGDFTQVENWADTLAGHDVVLHLAARVHVMNETAENPLAEFRKMNVDLTENIGIGAQEAGVKSFLLLSSIKVNGEGAKNPYRANDEPAPQDPYGISKLEAENKLSQIRDISPVFIRPGLIYGPGVAGNFERIFKLAQTKIPIPLKAVDNARSMISVSNLANLIDTLIAEPLQPRSTVLAADANPVSTAQLITIIRRLQDRSPRLFWIPQGFLQFGLNVIGPKGKALSDRLLGSLEIHTSSTDPTFSWSAPYEMKEEIQKMIEHSK